MFSEIWIKTETFSFKKLHLTMLSAKKNAMLRGFLNLISAPGPHINIKMSSYQYRKSHCGDKTILRPSYLHNGVSYTGKTISLYWIGALVPYCVHFIQTSICRIWPSIPISAPVPLPCAPCQVLIEGLQEGQPGRALQLGSTQRLLKAPGEQPLVVDVHQ